MRLYPCCMPIYRFSCLAAFLVASSVSAEAQAPPESSQKPPQPVDSNLPRAQPPDASDDDPTFAALRRFTDLIRGSLERIPRFSIDPDAERGRRIGSGRAQAQAADGRRQALQGLGEPQAL